MSRSSKSLVAKLFTVLAIFGATYLVGAPAASADTVPAPLVHATPTNDCKLNVRVGPSTSNAILGTLNCVNYTSCVHAKAGGTPCEPLVVGGKYTCAGPDNKPVTDDRWIEVAWRAPQPSYVAFACAAIRH